MAARHKSRKRQTRKGSLVSQVQRGAIKPGLRLAKELTGLGTSLGTLGTLKNKKNGWLFGDGQRSPRYGKKSKLTISQAKSRAYGAGLLDEKNGERNFQGFLEARGLDAHGEAVIKGLREAYDRGYSEGERLSEKYKDHPPKRGRHNPAVSAAQYRLAQAVLSGTARTSDMPKSVAQEIVDRTPAKLRSQFMKMKLNPDAEAAAMHEAFTGYPSEYVEEVITERHVHEWLAGIGDMVLLVVTTADGKQAEIGFNGYDLKTDELTAPDGDRVRCAVNESGTQIYLEGGDQSLDLEALGLDEVAIDRDKVEIGTADRIVYFTRKRFDDGEPINYQHEFNEEERGRLRDAKPVVIYDTLNQSIELAGGRYHVELEEQVDGMSPGLVN